ncbi:mitochondrial import receptor subunit TOM7 homolog [Microplitis demolitor]|uniref:mitochondrial import receptor subunit TOM7 homolog n=1 Tax=Microplitis demolitor TaxID=69319 RepID=UPI0004CDB45D|nr:mitochondrial import receptor subunit TOM7 homolog [Microplitis demolitor]
MAMTPRTKQKVSTVLEITKTVFHWGFIPTVIYLGFRKGADPGMTPLTLMSLLWY